MDCDRGTSMTQETTIYEIDSWMTVAQGIIGAGPGLVQVSDVSSRCREVEIHDARFGGVRQSNEAVENLRERVPVSNDGHWSTIDGNSQANAQ